MKLIKSPDYYMQKAFREALKAYKAEEVPVGAIAVRNGKIIARSHNQKENKQSPTAHAELLVMQKAAKKLKSWRLLGVTIYSTLEPCPMCAGIIVLSMLEGVVAGSNQQDMKNYRLKNSNKHYLWRNFEIRAKKILQSGIPKPYIIENFMREECNKLYHN